MSTTNDNYANLAAQIATDASQGQADVQALGSVISTAIADLKAAVQKAQAASVDPTVISSMQSSISTFEAIHQSIGALTTSTQAADPGPQS